MNQITRLMIVDDQRVYAEGLKYVIESRTDEFEVMDIAENGAEAIEIFKRCPSDIVLMDIHMPVMNGVEATRIIHELCPSAKILVLTTFDDDEYVRSSIEFGAVGYLLKNRSPDHIIDSLRALKDGILQIDPAVSGKLFRSFLQRSAGDEVQERLKSLTQREREVLRLLVAASGINKISKDLGIAQQTVRNHISNIYSKLDIHNQIEVLRYVHQIRFFLENEQA